MREDVIYTEGKPYRGKKKKIMGFSGRVHKRGAG